MEGIVNSPVTSTDLLHTIIRTLNGSNFAATVGDFYRGEVAVLNVIHLFEDQHKEVFPSMISTFLHISRPTVTSALRTLEHKKLIKRRLFEEDRRMISVSLTQGGKDVVKKKREEIDSWSTSMANHFGNENFMSLLHSIKELLEYME